MILSTFIKCLFSFKQAVRGFWDGSVIKNLPAMQETKDAGWILGSERCPTGGNGNLLQYSCLENPRNRVVPGRLQSMGSQRVRCD